MQQGISNPEFCGDLVYNSAGPKGGGPKGHVPPPPPPPPEEAVSVLKNHVLLKEKVGAEIEL